MNILILSVGTRNKIVQYFKKELKNKGLVIATDASNLAPALYEADKYYIVPKITDSNYLEEIFKICKENNVKGVLSLIDPELEILSKNKDKFIEIGTTPIISDFKEVSIAFDKYKFFNKLNENKIKTIPTYNNLDSFLEGLNNNLISFPVFIKPNKGSASKDIGVVNSLEELKLKMNDDMIIQKLMNGPEYGADVYIDLIDGEIKSLFLKEKLLMRAGETDKSVSVKILEIESMIKELIKILPYKGIIDIDIFKHDNEYYISEVNPRFGGGYPHAYECGINIPNQIINNLNNIINVENFKYQEGKYMLKYNEVKII